MCRLLGVISVKPVNASRYLLEDPCSLYVQSRADPRRLQSDGWGVGFYRGGVLSITKSEKPLFEEYERFKALVEGISSNIVVAHVRRASNPRRLPRSRLISVENSQPFGYGRYVFAHNGVINLPDEAATLLGDWRSNIKGLNDSEVYFWYVVKELESGRSLPEALKSFREDLDRVWLENRWRHLDKDRPYNGLNIVFSDGWRLYAYCEYDEDGGGRVESLCYRDQPGMQMVYVYDRERLVVASEKTNLEEDWLPLKSRQLIVGWIADGRVEVSLQEV